MWIHDVVNELLKFQGLQFTTHRISWFKLTTKSLFPSQYSDFTASMLSASGSTQLMNGASTTTTNKHPTKHDSS